MNYRNYEGKIVEKYGVELKGWPIGSGICNPGTLGGRPQLEKLLSALESGQCNWVVLSDDELEERKRHNQAREDCGEQVYCPHKSATRRTDPKGAKSAETIDDEEEEHDELTTKRSRNEDHNGDSDSDDEQEPSTKRARLDDDDSGGDSDSDKEQGSPDNTGNVTGDGDQDGAGNAATDATRVEDSAENNNTSDVPTA
jgi:hypothetical protein